MRSDIIEAPSIVPTADASTSEPTPPAIPTALIFSRFTKPFGAGEAWNEPAATLMTSGFGCAYSYGYDYGYRIHR